MSTTNYHPQYGDVYEEPVNKNGGDVYEDGTYDSSSEEKHQANNNGVVGLNESDDNDISVDDSGNADSFNSSDSSTDTSDDGADGAGNDDNDGSGDDGNSGRSGNDDSFNSSNDGADGAGNDDNDGAGNDGNSGSGTNGNSGTSGNDIDVRDSGNDNSQDNDDNGDNRGNDSSQDNDDNGDNRDNSDDDIAFADSFNDDWDINDDDLIDLDHASATLEGMIGKMGDDGLFADGGQNLLGDGNIFAIEQVVTLDDRDSITDPDVYANMGHGSGDINFEAHNIDGGEANDARTEGNMAADNSSSIAAGVQASAGAYGGHEAFNMNLSQGANVTYTSVDQTVVGGDGDGVYGDEA